MKLNINRSQHRLALSICLSIGLLFPFTGLYAQATTEETPEVMAPVKAKPVKNTFQSIWIIDNQTVMVPVKGTLEMDIMHRFGVINKGFDDLWGFFAPSNIRLGVNYAPINNLLLGMGLTKYRMLWDGNAKYALLRQTPGKYPVSVTYFGSIAYDLRKDPDNSIFNYQSERFSFFNQLIIARKITDELSIQIAPSLSHQNSVNGYYTKNDSTGTDVFKEMRHDHIAIAVSGRYKLSEVISVMVNYDQPLTKHATRNPNPNLSFGLEFNTSAHAFQIFAGNYSLISPQHNNLYNDNSILGYTDIDDEDVPGGRFVIGFNITRLWNY